MQYSKVFNPPRKLRDSERELLVFLLKHPFPGRDQLSKQLSATRVSAACQCGCPSIELTVDNQKVAPAPVGQRIPVEGEGLDSDGHKIFVLLHVVNGYLHELEIYREDLAPLRLPSSGQLRIFSWKKRKLL